MIVINSILIEVILNMYLFYNTLIWVQKCFLLYLDVFILLYTVCFRYIQSNTVKSCKYYAGV